MKVAGVSLPMLQMCFFTFWWWKTAILVYRYFPVLGLAIQVTASPLLRLKFSWSGTRKDPHVS
jgi:hypothetical protein